MDFRGQAVAERLYTWIVVVAGCVAFPVGYLNESFGLMLSIFFSGVGLALLLTVPDWPPYHQHPLKWLPARPHPPSDASDATTGRGWANLWGLL